MKIRTKELQLQTKKLDFDQKSESQRTRASLIKTLIEQNKTAEEINQYLTLLHYE